MKKLLWCSIVVACFLSLSSAPVFSDTGVTVDPDKKTRIFGHGKHTYEEFLQDLQSNYVVGSDEYNEFKEKIEKDFDVVITDPETQNGEIVTNIDPDKTKKCNGVKATYQEHYDNLMANYTPGTLDYEKYKAEIEKDFDVRITDPAPSSTAQGSDSDETDDSSDVAAASHGSTTENTGVIVDPDKKKRIFGHGKHTYEEFLQELQSNYVVGSDEYNDFKEKIENNFDVKITDPETQNGDIVTNVDPDKTKKCNGTRATYQEHYDNLMANYTPGTLDYEKYKAEIEKDFDVVISDPVASSDEDADEVVAVTSSTGDEEESFETDEQAAEEQAQAQAQENMENEQKDAEAAAKEAEEAIAALGDNTYVVQSGDCLWKIAENYFGEGQGYRWTEIAEMQENMDLHPSMTAANGYIIHTGWVLHLPPLKDLATDDVQVALDDYEKSVKAYEEAVESYKQAKAVLASAQSNMNTWKQTPYGGQESFNYLQGKIDSAESQVQGAAVRVDSKDDAMVEAQEAAKKSVTTFSDVYHDFEPDSDSEQSKEFMEKYSEANEAFEKRLKELEELQTAAVAKAAAN